MSFLWASCAILLMCDTLAAKYLLRFVVFMFAAVDLQSDICGGHSAGNSLAVGSPNSLRQTRKLAEHAM